MAFTIYHDFVMHVSGLWLSSSFQYSTPKENLLCALAYNTYVAHAFARCMQASLLYKTNKYFHINKNNTELSLPLLQMRNTGYHKASSFAQPQSKCLVLLF
jgi:hypothetical protein